VHTHKTKILRYLAVLAVISFLFYNSRTITSPLRVKLSLLLSPSLDNLHSLASSVKGILPFASLREENRILAERADLLERRLEEARILSNENNRLRELLEFSRSAPYSSIPAQVIGRDPSNWSNSLIINKGIFQGIKQNSAILSTKGLVGRVLELGRNSSKVLLITDPNSKVGVIIERNRQGGILIGRPDGRCKMIYIGLDSDVYPGDKVITAGLGSIYPKDVMVGEVMTVDKEPGRLYKYAIIKTAQDLSKLEEVLCIK